MTVKELIEKLQEMPQDVDVMTKKTEIFGNVGHVFSVRKDSYSFFGVSCPCIILSDESNEEEGDEAE